MLLAIGAWGYAQPAPEADSGYRLRPPARSMGAMVVSADARASQTAIEVLREGGSAVDAAIAAALVLNLVEPQSSGIGGGAFLLHFDAGLGRLTSYDGRETAPADADPQRFLDPAGRPLAFRRAVADARAVGVPGALRMYELAHRRHGRLPWARLFEPAMRMARNGFTVSARLHHLLALEIQAGRLAQPAARQSLLGADGIAPPVGSVRRNPEFAATLAVIAEGGADAFYRGAIAREIVRVLGTHPQGAGDLTLDDLAAYRAIERPPVCADYRRHRVCGMGPPSSGATTVLSLLGMLERFDLAQLDPRSAIVTHLFAEAGRRAFADRDRLVADPDFVPVPVDRLLDADYLRRRAATIRWQQGGRQAEAGLVAQLQSGADDSRPSTSHLSIVDRWGDAVALTASIEDAFGNRTMAAGFLLNNQLTDFSFAPTRDGVGLANRVEGGKRPRSSMAPTMVFSPDGRLRAVLGSPGGSQIINYVAQAVSGLLDFRLSAAELVERPRAGSRNGPTELEPGPDAERQAPVLRALGHELRIAPMTSGLNLIVREDGAWVGAADPRREGLAIGE